MRTQKRVPPEGGADTARANHTNVAAVGNSVCMPPASAAVSGRLATRATDSHANDAVAPSWRQSCQTPQPSTASQARLTGPRASRPIISCGIACRMSVAQGARAQTCRRGSGRYTPSVCSCQGSPR